MSDSKPILDQELNARCKHKRCPTDAQLRQFPMLDEDEFEEVDERLYHCKKCRERSEQIEAQKN